MEIIKADGTREEFKPEKLVNSLKRAGASKSEVEYIVKEIERSLRDGMHTHKIYSKAFRLLRESDDTAAAKYSLRRAVFNLGPTGFPFEDYLGRIFEAEGYKTKQRVTLRGKCAVHEVDLAAYSQSDTFIAEAKFHTRPGVKSDLQVAMYSYARYLDLESARICPNDECGIISLYIITNTKFTKSATRYAECTGIKLLSWNYPEGDSLHNKIERNKVYPVTVLSNLSQSQKQSLLKSGILLCTELAKNHSILNQLRISGKKREKVLAEIASLCGSD